MLPAFAVFPFLFPIPRKALLPATVWAPGVPFSFCPSIIPPLHRAVLRARLQDHRLPQRFLAMGIVALLATLPYGLPILIDSVLGRDIPNLVYLRRSVDNQLYHLLIGAAIVLIPSLLWMVVAPPKRLPRNLLTPLVTLFFGVIALGNAMAAGAEFNPRTLLMPVAFLATFLAVLLAFPNRQSCKLLLQILIVSALPIGLYALYQSQGGEILPYSSKIPGTLDDVEGKQRVASTFGHPNYMASFLVPITFLSAWAWASEGSRIRRFLGLATFVVSLAAMLAGGARGGWLAIAIGAVPFVAICAQSPRWRRPLLFAAGLTFVTVLLLLVVPNPLLKVRFNVLDRLFASKEIATRFYYWLIALRLWSDHPLLGVGYGNYDVRFWEAVSAFQLEPRSEYYRYVLAEMIRGVRPLYVHNDHLQIATESGAVGITLWFVVWSVLLAQLLEFGRRWRQHAPLVLLAGALAGAFTGMAADALTNFPFHLPVSGAVFWALVAVWIIIRAEAENRWWDLQVDLPPPKITDTLVPEIPRVKPQDALRRGI